MKGNEGYIIAVDLGGTNLRCAVADIKRDIIACVTRPSGASLDSAAILAGIEEGIAEAVRISGKDMRGIEGMGIGMPGIVDTEKGVLHKAANFPSMRDVPIAGIFKEKYKKPVFLFHDVDMATVAERQFGAGRGKNHVVCIMIGTGIGMGMILNGQLYRGAHDGAGNLGHMILGNEVRLTSHPHDAILEKMAAAPAIRSMAIEAVRQGKSSLLDAMCGRDPEKIDARMVFHAAREGDEHCIRIVQETAQILAIGIANIINLLSPEIIILGGGVAMAGNMLFEPLIKSVTDIVSRVHSGEINIVPSRLGTNGVLRGVAHTVWDLL